MKCCSFLLLIITIIIYNCHNFFSQNFTDDSKTIKKLELSSPQTMVFYGTSLTAGGNWVNQLSIILFQKYGSLVNIVNSAESGKDSKWGIDNIRNKVLRFRPDCVFIEFAINDVLWKEPDGVNNSKYNLERMIDSIILTKPDCEIILMTMNPRNGDSHFQKKMSEFYRVYNRVSEERKLRLVDNYPDWMNLFESNPTAFDCYVKDGVHPSFKGHEIITLPNVFDILGLDYQCSD